MNYWTCSYSGCVLSSRRLREKGVGMGELFDGKKGIGIFSRSIRLTSRCLMIFSSSNSWCVRSFWEDRWLQVEECCTKWSSPFNCLISDERASISAVCWWTRSCRESIFLFILLSRSKENHSSSRFAILLQINLFIFTFYTDGVWYTIKTLLCCPVYNGAWTRAEGSMYPIISLPSADHFGCQYPGITRWRWAPISSQKIFR